MLKNPKAKGKVLEKWVAEQLRRSGLDPYARPEIGSGSGRFKGDIATRIPLTIECKNTAVFKVMQFVKQAEKASLGYRDAVVIWHPPQTSMESSRVFITWQLFEKLLKSFLKSGVAE